MITRDEIELAIIKSAGSLRKENGMLRVDQIDVNQLGAKLYAMIYHSGDGGTVLAPVAQAVKRRGRPPVKAKALTIGTQKKRKYTKKSKYWKQ